MSSLERLQKKVNSLEKVSAKEVRAELDRVQAMIHKAETLKSVAGMIPESILNSIESALNIVVPLTAFLGDFELTTLLSALKVWLSKKRVENQQADAQRNAFNDLGYSSYWTS